MGVGHTGHSNTYTVPSSTASTNQQYEAQVGNKQTKQYDNMTKVNALSASMEKNLQVLA